MCFDPARQSHTLYAAFPLVVLLDLNTKETLTNALFPPTTYMLSKKKKIKHGKLEPPEKKKKKSGIRGQKCEWDDLRTTSQLSCTLFPRFFLSLSRALLVDASRLTPQWTQKHTHTQTTTTLSNF